jgi:hypothetical protein
MMDPPEDLPRGLVFRSLRASSGRRSYVLLALAATIAAGLAFIWPVYPLVPAIEPYILGLPFSFAWVVGWMTVVFGALFLLYQSEDPPEAE